MIASANARERAANPRPTMRRAQVSKSAPARSQSHHAGLSRANKVKSKAQQRLLYARGYVYAHAAAKSGAQYRALPARVKPRTA
jgi:hypothetical protein